MIRGRNGIMQETERKVKDLDNRIKAIEEGDFASIIETVVDEVKKHFGHRVDQMEKLVELLASKVLADNNVKKIEEIPTKKEKKIKKVVNKTRKPKKK